jgi:hypothetical protein
LGLELLLARLLRRLDGLLGLVHVCLQLGVSEGRNEE